MSETWRPIGVFVMPLVDMRFVIKGRANANEPPLTRMEPAAFLALVEESGPDDDPPAAA
ncbi:hypothetical protein [Tabrizicola soli]|uniref:Uncharacterized protein n=1 Tax=Tabrizicola soli TaxID=2185115 RepID=A0ABV7DZC4_9RHOB|nr:hypothetical protein [Tabrizicola soli]